MSDLSGQRWKPTFFGTHARLGDSPATIRCDEWAAGPGTVSLTVPGTLSSLLALFDRWNWDYETRTVHVPGPSLSAQCPQLARKNDLCPDDHRLCGPTIPGSSNASRYLHPALCLCPLAAHYHKPQSSPSEVPVRASPPAYLVSQKPAGFSGCPPPHRPSRPLIGSRFLNDDEETRNQKGFSVFPTRKARRARTSFGPLTLSVMSRKLGYTHAVQLLRFDWLVSGQKSPYRCHESSIPAGNDEKGKPIDGCLPETGFHGSPISPTGNG
ncbi:hypothetical protein B0H65DRAFT_574113 [Neurospora tetraspora]|uniref:Uncharacterized protein n=1 Tax=Neurospora tetraspora TaxID=94610 RepID=A0AAE0MT50_9PEZI|nr:hypothetical protein B0H65DRAFT_574113 [Neurospora tetraspora]